ncbi:MAG: SPASM domain-containing protein, partial [Calditrichaeota bacterium]|nr:SPASM domain-containing protein [Calditrichota bacterium]
PMCMFNPVSHGFGNKGCSACDGLLSVGANGDVIPCASYDESVGNLLREDFGDIWQSQRARQFRTKFWAHSKCQNCDQLPICHGGCPLYWRQMGYGELDK